MLRENNRKMDSIITTALTVAFHPLSPLRIWVQSGLRVKNSLQILVQLFITALVYCKWHHKRHDPDQRRLAQN